jgi:hypothetical protein
MTTKYTDSAPTTESPARPDRSPVDRRTVLTGAGGILLALAGGIGTAAATDTETGLQYNEDTTVDDAGASITYSLTNHSTQAIIIDVITLARISIPQMAVDDRDGPTLRISVTGNGHDTTMSKTVSNGGMFLLVEEDNQGSIPPGETATVTVGPYYDADVDYIGGSAVVSNEMQVDLRGESFETPAEIWYHYARTTPGAPESGRYEFTHQPL